MEDPKWAEEVSSRIDPEAVTWVKEQLRKDPIIEKMKGELHANSQPTGPCSTGVSSSLANTASYNVAVCVSFSAPDQIWTDLSKGLELLGGAFVLRGIPENSFKLLAEKVLHLQQVGVRAPILIDPLLFSQNHVEVIPTFLIVEGDKVDKISGNLSLSYVIEKMATDGETTKAKELLVRLKEPS